MKWINIFLIVWCIKAFQNQERFAEFMKREGNSLVHAAILIEDEDYDGWCIVRYWRDK